MSEPTRSDRLAADRDRLEAVMAGADAKALPALVREHRLVLKELESLAVPKKGSVRDQVAEKRAARQARAAGAAASEVRQ
jgi:hypothetical protein